MGKQYILDIIVSDTNIIFIPVIAKCASSSLFLIPIFFIPIVLVTFVAGIVLVIMKAVKNKILLGILCGVSFLLLLFFRSISVVMPCCITLQIGALLLLPKITIWISDIKA